MSARAVEFWFDFASTYSYPAAMTLRQAAGARGIHVIWRPFLLGPIFGELGWTDSPFNLQPAKGRYMWRDLERLCDAADLPFQRPPGFPQHSVNAARIALFGLEQGWGEGFICTLFHAQFASGQDIADPETLADAVTAAGGVPDQALKAASGDEIKGALRAAVEEAKVKAIFGAPTYFAGPEMFWGYDRQHAALDWAATHPNQGENP